MVGTLSLGLGTQQLRESYARRAASSRVWLHVLLRVSSFCGRLARCLVGERNPYRRDRDA
jgi:hypothetical protein